MKACGEMNEIDIDQQIKKLFEPIEKKEELELIDEY